MGENLDELKENAADILKTFSRLFLRNCGSSLLDDVRADIIRKKEEQKEVTWRLSKREGGSKRKDKLYRGELWMRSGQGAGDFDKWKKVYVVEEESYRISIYENEESLKENKKPIATIQPAGYELLTTNIRDYFQNAISSIVTGLRHVDAEALTADMEPFSWALAHPNRTNYMFLARPSKVKHRSTASMMCNFCSKKVEPDTVEETDEERELRESATNFMTACVECAQPRELKSVEGRAFDMTVREMPEELEQLDDDWTDDGTEAEILVDVLMEVLLETRRNKMLNERKGPLAVRLKAWYKMRMGIHKVLSLLVDKTWMLARAGITILRENLEPILHSGLEPVVEAKMKIEEKIKEAVIDNLSTHLEDKVTPFIKPLMGFFEKHLVASLSSGRTLLEEKLSPENLPADAKERDAYLERLLNDGESRQDLYKSFDEMETALQNLRDMSEISGRVFQGAKLQKLRSQVQQPVDEILDAAIYTFIIRLNPSAYREMKDSSSKDDNKGVTNEALEPDTERVTTEKETGAKEMVAKDTVADPAPILRQVLEDFDHDIQIVRTEFIKSAVHSLLLRAFHRLSDRVIKPILRRVNEKIPDRFEKFLSLERALDEIVDRFIWQPVEQMVEAEYPLPSDNKRRHL